MAICGEGYSSSWFCGAISLDVVGGDGGGVRGV